MEATDESIAKQVQSGDTDAFGELIVRYEQKLKRYARKFLNYDHEIEDLVQDVFIKAYTNIQSFDTELRFSPWVYRIAHNTFVNELKRKSKHGVHLFDIDTILPFIAAKETTDGELMDKETNSEMEAHVQELPPKYREVIVLHYFESFSYQEISEILKIPITTVGVRMTRARKKLKEYYKHNNPHHE